MTINQFATQFFGNKLINNDKSFSYTTIFHPHTPYCPPDWVIKKVLPNKKLSEEAYSIQTDFHAWLNGNYGNDKSYLNTYKMDEVFFSIKSIIIFDDNFS